LEADVKVRIENIIVKKRIRDEIGDISDLMESISRFGLLNPITVTDKMELLAGFRRLEACKALGQEEIECTVVAAPTKIDRLLIEADENLTRKDLTVNEIENYEDQKRFLRAHGLEKIWLWILRIIKLIKKWFNTYILRRGN
jgi:ParB family chromosome partitioning protein